MNISDAGISLIKSFEGLRLEAYQDSAGIWTIGYGCIRYPSNYNVKQYDTCTAEQAENFLRHDIKRFVDGLNKRIAGIALTQQQFDSLVSFCYNLGLGSLDGSNLYKKLKVNPDDPTIYTYARDSNGPVVDSCEFLKWVRAGGKVVKGLAIRRAKEADFYNSKNI